MWPNTQWKNEARTGTEFAGQSTHSANMFAFSSTSSSNPDILETFASIW